MTFLTEFFLSKRPTLSAGSIKTYVSTVGSLFRGLYPTETLTVSTIGKLNDEKKVIDWLKANKTPASRKPFLSALAVIFNNEAYREAMLQDAKILKKDLDKQLMTPEMAENWISQDDIKKRLDELKKDAFKQYHSASPDLQQIQQYIILCLLGSQYIQPRRAKDYTDFKIKNINKESDNYIEKGEMVFNSFKTVKTAGQQRIEIPKQLKTILNKWIKVNPTEYLLFDVNGSQLSSPQLNQRINKIFGSSTGVGVNMMRHSFLTEKYADGIQKKKELVKDLNAMGTSIAEAKFYIQDDPSKGHNGPPGPHLGQYKMK
jgi:integrase